MQELRPNEKGGRKFWTNERLIDLISDVNALYDQDNEMMPSYGQIVEFFKITDIQLYQNKKHGAPLAAMTSMGNLNWVETAEKYGKKIIPGKSQRINPNYIKAFVRDLGEHLAVLTPPELYVLFQAQGIGRKDEKYSRTFDLLIDAVQNGEVKK